jgi:TolB protein
MNSDGTGLAQLAESQADDLAPAYSPDGTQIAFSSNRTGKWEIYTLALATGQVNRLTFQADPDGQGWPAWSPDGSQIAFESRGVANGRDIFLMNADGSDVKNITNSSSYEGAPIWSPDGKKLAFASDKDGTLSIYIMNNDGSQIQRLTSVWAWGPSWSSQ